MSLALIGKDASYEFRWRRWALLRDTIAAHLEEAKFPRFFEIGGALGTGSIRISAAELTQEIDAIEAGLGDKPVDALMIGPRTAAVLYPGVAAEDPRPLTRPELSQIAPIGDEKNLRAYFASMLGSIRDVCARPFDDGCVEAIDG